MCLRRATRGGTEESGMTDRPFLPRQWLKPSECARRIGHRDSDVVIAAIRKGELLARQRELPNGRVRYLVHVDDFDRWFDRTWKPTQQAS